MGARGSRKEMIMKTEPQPLNPAEPTCVQLARMGTVIRSSAVRDILALWEMVLEARAQLAQQINR